jgi:hypothetical protein
LYIPRHMSEPEFTSFRTPKLNTHSVPTRHSITNPYHPTNSSSADHPDGFAHMTQSPRLSLFHSLLRITSLHRTLALSISFGKACRLHVLFRHRRLRASGQWKHNTSRLSPGKHYTGPLPTCPCASTLDRTRSNCAFVNGSFHAIDSVQPTGISSRRSHFPRKAR